MHISLKKYTFLQINVYDISILHKKCIRIIIYNFSENCKIKSLKKKKKKKKVHPPNRKDPMKNVYTCLIFGILIAPPPFPHFSTPPPPPILRTFLIMELSGGGIAIPKDVLLWHIR